MWYDYVLYVILAVVAVFVLLFLVAIVRTLFNGKKKEIVDNFATKIDGEEKYANALSKLINHETIAVKVGGKQSNFDEYFNDFVKVFPNFCKSSERIEIDKAYFFKLKGKSSDKPVMFMSHSDIVEAQGEWTYPPFSGTIADGKIWGRGTMDTKGMLVSFVSALENMCEKGIVPNQDIYVLSSHDEEVFGEGAINVNKYCNENNIKCELILDEGGSITEKIMPGIKNDIALIGVCEKGYIDIKFTAKSNGGHSSTPPKNTPLARIAKMINDFETHSYFKRQLIAPVKGMFATLSPYMSFPLRLLLSNVWLFGGVLKVLLPKVSGQIAAMLQTTMVFTQAVGSGAPNVIPQSSHVVANLRNLPTDSFEDVVAKVTKVASKYDIEVEVLQYKSESSISPIGSQAYNNLVKVINEQFAGVLVTPYVMLGGTDSCKMGDSGDNIFRFCPIRATKAQVSSVHAVNENIGVAELAKAVDFFEKFISQL